MGNSKNTEDKEERQWQKTGEMADGADLPQGKENVWHTAGRCGAEDGIYRSQYVFVR